MIPDLRIERFVLHVGNCTSDRDGVCTETELFAYFGEPDECGEFPNSVVSSSLVLPIDSDLAKKIRQITETTKKGMEAREATYSARIAKIRDMLCDRVARCHGIVDGECWALGKAGIRKVIEEA